MGNHFLVKAVSFSLAVIFPATMAMGEMKGAILRGSGGALLNGTVARQGSAVLNGDVIQSAKGSTIISASGSTVLLADDSRVQYRNESISLQTGNAQVATTSGMSAKVDRITVKPTGKSGKFAVGMADGKVLVSALNGSVSVFDATHSMVVPEGETATLDPQQQDDKDRKKPTAGAEWDNAGGWGMSRKTAIILGAGAAGAAAAILWLTTDTPSSPSHP